MNPGLDISTLKQKSLQFVHLLGNEHDTTSSAIITLLADEFSVQHGESLPSTGGRDAFLNKLGKRLKMAKGHASVEINHLVAEPTEDAAHGGQCWVYSRKNTPFGSSLSVRSMSPRHGNPFGIYV